MLRPPDPRAPAGVNPASAHVRHAVENGSPRFDPLRRDAAWLVGGIALSYPIGLALEPRFLLPVLNAVPAWWLMARRLRAGDLRGAILLMLIFPVALAVMGTSFLALWPTPDGLIPHVFNGPQYREEMFHWIRTGEGSEGNWRLFLPLHITHLTGFVIVSLLTGSLVSITGGAILTNYMDGYVASIHRAGAPLWATLFFGWQPWAICRVAAFCILGVLLAEPVLSRVFRYKPQPWSAVRPWLLTAIALIAGDWMLKAAFAPTWGLILRDAIPFR
ncbi:MAG: hypothetical protein ABIP62_10310 [Vicinamibacteria bacterium]